MYNYLVHLTIGFLGAILGSKCWSMLVQLYLNSYWTDCCDRLHEHQRMNSIDFGDNLTYYY